MCRAAGFGQGRFVSRSWLLRAAEPLQGRFALHLCGRQVRTELLGGRLDAVVTWAARVQVNGILSIADCVALKARLPLQVELVTQHGPVNAPLLGPAVERHAILVDSSGGRGRLPPQWVRPDTPKRVGFAGGLGPHNLHEQLPRIAQAAGWAPFWVDMEASLRDTTDRFDLERARAALAACNGWTG